MKKLLGLILAIASITFVGSTANAKTNAAGGAAAAQYGQRNRRWNYRRPRVITRTRIVQRGRHRYRETYQVVYRPNGNTETRLISRVRIA